MLLPMARLLARSEEEKTEDPKGGGAEDPRGGGAEGTRDGGAEGPRDGGTEELRAGGTEEARTGGGVSSILGRTSAKTSSLKLFQSTALLLLS